MGADGFSSGDGTDDAFSWVLSQFGEDPSRVRLGGDEIDRITKYLVDPVRTGVWVYTGTWRYDDAFSGMVWREIESKVIGGSAKGDRRKSSGMTQEGIGKYRDRSSRRMSFVLAVFCWLVDREYLFTPMRLASVNNVDLAIIRILDREAVRSKYSEALKIFEDELFFDGFSPSLATSGPHRFKSGWLFAIKSSKDETGFEFGATQPLVLQSLLRFMVAVEKVSDGQVMPIFSPEERVFAPYFSFLQTAFPYLERDESVKPAFERAFADYGSGNFAGCIRNLGVIGEDYLIQIYETYFREPCPKGQTLGQVFDLVNRRVGEKFKKPLRQPLEMNPVFDRVRELLARKSLTPSSQDYEDLVKLVRDVLGFVKEDRSRTLELIHDLAKEPVSVSVIPRDLRESVVDLIRYRNAVSHRTRVVIGSYEALRSVYICVTLMLWWREEKRMTDWSVSAEEIIASAVVRHNPGFSLVGKKP